MKQTFPAAITLLLLASSCSWYRSLERSLVEDDAKQAKKEHARSKTVPREQYDQLLVKYEELTKKYESLKDGKPEKSLVDEINNTQTENNFARTSPNADTETVNLGPNDPAGTPMGAPTAAAAATAGAATVAVVAVPDDVESQLELYRRGLAMKESNPGEATKIFQELEAKGAPAVQVRAKLQVGELLLSRQQYDLALQVFEDIITKHSDSGVVIDSLRYAEACATKLGLTAKKEQYHSMLNDVFEVQ
ncbi:MAG: tetratricopeptide repeat protein [Bacteriovoracaceae bacterium]